MHHLSLDTSTDYLATPPSSAREGAPPLRKHHSTPSWGVQTPTPQFYYTTVDMYREFSNCTDSSYPITPASDEEYRAQYVVDSPPHSASSSPQSSGTITPEMLRTVSGAMPPSPLATPPDVIAQGLSQTCAFPGCAFIATDIESMRRHTVMFHTNTQQTPKQVPPPSLVMDDNGVASVSFIKRESPSSAYLQETAFDEEDDIVEGYQPFDVTGTPTPQLYSVNSPYGMTRSNTMPSSTPTRTPTVPRFYHPYQTSGPMTPVSYSRQLRNQHQHQQHSHSLSDPSMAASLALLPSQAQQYMSPPTPPSRGATPLSRSLSRSTRSSPNLPLVVSALDKSHVCEICQKRFKRLEHLRRHNKTHTGERGFRCEVVGCGKWFSRSDNLMAHKRYFVTYIPANMIERMENVVDETFMFPRWLCTSPFRDIIV
jgi:Zinc finger, C2H2 type